MGKFVTKYPSMRGLRSQRYRQPTVESVSAPRAGGFKRPVSLRKGDDLLSDDDRIKLQQERLARLKKMPP